MRQLLIWHPCDILSNWFNVDQSLYLYHGEDKGLLEIIDNLIWLLSKIGGREFSKCISDSLSPFG